jgi:hypothetical protein
MAQKYCAGFARIGLTAQSRDTEMANDVLLPNRAATHGCFTLNAEISQHFKEYARQCKGWADCSDVQRESIDQIFLKLSRILSGQPSFLDHWVDLEGYSKLGRP